MPAPRPHKLLAALAALTAVGGMLALAGTVAVNHWLPAAFWHLVFAVGALPLILSAMAYFVPVLTRTPEPPRALTAVPLAALAAGAGIVVWFAEGTDLLRETAPLAALAAAAAMGAWIVRRWQQCLGRPHPCLRWYAAALGCLALGLAAVAVSPWWPEQMHGLRVFHLHINTLGFMGLTAIGTLQVLLPTVLGRPDPSAGLRLIRDLPWSAAGALGIAVGAAWWWPLAIPATAAYAWPLARLLRDVKVSFGGTALVPRQAAPLLLSAIAGLLVVLAHGLGHGAGLGRARDVLPLFVIGFLLPLVSGAATQLLPVWLRPGAQGDWHRGLRGRLAAFARSRALLFFAAGLAAGAGVSAAYALGIAGAAWLAGSVVFALIAAGRKE